MTPEFLHETLLPSLARIEIGTVYHTPDHQRSSRFTLLERNAERLIVQTQGGARLRLPIEAFIRTVVYLHHTNATEATPARIGSSNHFPAGLCNVARGQNGRTRIINYVLPILVQLSWVEIDGRNRPNTAWLDASVLQLAI